MTDQTTKPRWIAVIKLGTIVSIAGVVIAALLPGPGTANIPLIVVVSFLFLWASEGTPGV